MFQDVDESLRALLVAEVPVDRAEVDISFERPSREWSGRLTRPTINLFLYDLRERVDFRDDSWKVRAVENGRFERTRGPRRVDLSYLITAWTKEPADEHRILGRVMPVLYRHTQIPPDVLRGAAAQATTPILARCMPSDHVAKPADFWGVMDNEFRVALVWVITTPVDVFAPTEGPLVTTATTLVRDTGGEGIDRFLRIGGVVHERGDVAAPIAYTRLQVMGTGASASSGPDGRFVFHWLPPGKQTWRVEAPGREVFEIEVDVPSPTYNVEVGAPPAPAPAPSRRRRAT